MPQPRVRLALAVTVPALVLATVGPAQAHRDPHNTAISFHSHFDDPGFLTGFQSVDPTPPGVPQDAVFHGSSTVTGPVLSGTVEYTIWGHPQSNGSFAFHTFETLTGSLRGCGHGKISYTVDGETSGAPPTMGLTGTVAFVAGSGTDGMRRISTGSGTLRGTTSVTTANSGDFDGQVVCGASES